MNKETLTEALKATPPVAVSAMTMNEWVAVATVAYIIMQALYLLRKWWREERGNK